MKEHSVILGIGSNMGDRLAHMRQALRLIKKIPGTMVEQVSPVYISDALLPENCPEEWNHPYLNAGLRCKTSLNPYVLLQQIKTIEASIGRKPEKRWAPRIIDIDILAWEDFIQYDDKLHIPHERLHERPFALWPLADVAPDWIYPLPGIYQGKTAAEIVAPWGSRFSGEVAFHTRQILQRIDTPQLIGILNVTPNSFSGDGKHQAIAEAINQVHHLIHSGAEIIDIGAEATNPYASPIDAKTEWERLEPLLKNIEAEFANFLLPPKISIDTRNAAVAEKALELKVDWINDVSGLGDETMRAVVKDSTCQLIFMHHLTIPADKNVLMTYDQNPIAVIQAWAEKRLAEIEAAGIARERLIFDVGIGFGKRAEQSLALIKNITSFKKLGIPLLIGHSRKQFISQFTHKEFAERDIETTILSLYLAKQNIDYLRIHNVEMNARAFKVLGAT